MKDFFTKERIFGTACSAFAGIYFADYAKKKEKFDFCLGAIYTILAIAWGVLGVRKALAGEEES